MSDLEPSLITVQDAEVVYDHIILALRGVSLEVRPRSIVALLGANGAGKTTTLKAISALLRAERGQLTRGRIVLAGVSGPQPTPRQVVAAGIVQVLEGRHCFPHLSIEENLVSGALARGPSRAELSAALERVYTHFPRLAHKKRSLAGYASGGEQQMLALGRALMGNPRVVLLDEPSMGLAPLVVAEIFEILRALNEKEGVAFLLAEQNATIALSYAHFGYILENGRVVGSGTGAELGARKDVKEFYLGASGDASGGVRARRRAAPESARERL